VSSNANSNEQSDLPGRLIGLDFLRGLAAISVMLYHYSTYMAIELLPKSKTDVIGLYGVSIFFVISGSVMWRRYGAIDHFGARDVLNFLIKRWFRIAPLVILATLANYLIFYTFADDTYKQFYDMRRIFVNFTFVNSFEYSKRNYSFITGGWSLQVEFAFYFLLGVLLFLVPRRYRLIAVCCLFLFGVYYRMLVFPFLEPGPLWIDYTHFFSQLLFFAAGILLVEIGSSMNTQHSRIMVAGAVILFAFANVHDAVNFFGYAYVGWKSTVFYGGLIVILTFAMMNINTTGMFEGISKIIGGISYSVYICHPLVYTVYHAMGGAKNVKGLAFCICAAFLIATCVYRWVEKPFMRAGARLSKL
jgi:exopolysaccharide production protein ExoZ